MTTPPKRILLIDDNADVRSSLQLALELAGYVVRTAASAGEGLRIQRREPADVVITDIFMPEGDGLEAIGALRQEFPATKIVVISGGGAERLKRDYLAAANLMTDVTFTKPVDIERLLQALQRLA